MTFKVGDRVRILPLCILPKKWHRQVSVIKCIGRFQGLCRLDNGAEVLMSEIELTARLVAPEHRSDVRPGPRWMG